MKRGRGGNGDGDAAIYAYVRSVLEQTDRRYTSLIEQIRREVIAEREWIEKLMAQQFASLALGVTKAETATEKRFDAVNEFREQLREQAASFVTRDVYAATLETLDEKVNAGTKAMSDRIEGLYLSRSTDAGVRAGHKEFSAATVTTVFIVTAAFGFLFGAISLVLQITGH